MNMIISTQLPVEDIAKVCHEVNRAYWVALGCTSQLPIEEAMNMIISTKLPVEDIARVCYEVNRAYCAALGCTSQLPWAALGGTSQLPWDDAPEWQRQASIDGVRFFLRNPDIDIKTEEQNENDIVEDCLFQAVVRSLTVVDRLTLGAHGPRLTVEMPLTWVEES